MKKIFIAFIALGLTAWCYFQFKDQVAQLPKSETENGAFEYEVDRFADIRILRYKLDGFDKLTTKQKELVYYLTQAGLAGRDIMWDQNCKYNLEVRSIFEKIYTSYSGDKTAEEWLNLETYLKQLWMSNGIHHHYSNIKHTPKFSKEYFVSLCGATNTQVSEEILEVIFNPNVANMKVESDASKGLVENSAVNFYEGVTTKEAFDFYVSKEVAGDRAPLSYGINANLRKENGVIVEDVYRVGGKYSAALEQVVFWLNKAEKVAENDKQAVALRKLVEFYTTGDLRTWDDFNIQWVKATEGDIDFIHGFVEVYNDPLGKRGSYESIVEINDFEASDRMKVMMQNAQWFEDNSPILPEHKKKEVKGITYKVVNVAGESGDANPSTPIGVNLPNAQWIRAMHGSKSVSLGNIEDAANNAGGSGMLKEFANDEEEIARAEKHGATAGKMHTAMHEVIGHASGQLEANVSASSQTLKEFASTIEEGRADLVALYYVMDPKLVEMGLMESLEVGKAEYDGYIRNAMMVQMRRLKMGEDIAEAHMRNRAWISNWIIEKGASANVISREVRDGKTYFNINNYDKMRDLVGELLREVQRITSQGDYNAAKALADGYGKKVDPTLHAEVLARSEKLNIPPYNGFVNPILTPVLDSNGKMIDVTVSYTKTFAEQMLNYSKNYGFLAPKK
ncbi:MAG: dihydrofolate reductase [Flavobacteriales bacterium]|nr:dihydrofolate reductase [Flavobacteriales bacterium]MDP4717434.1 dihydrofolate reductase [Flavobacteriales bacterium]MDP4731433.1 dihydrofolate reductase [Flavobacteriales bacterium]MDP4818946.1 dihydrofolate reductase [Flavobacteriales bacterium]